MPLLLHFGNNRPEAGVDEAGRGCLAGPVVAAAVILPPDFQHDGLDDSKKLSLSKRLSLRKIILEQAVSWNLGIISAPRIDQVNILNATYEAMHEALGGMTIKPAHLLIDGNRFRPYPGIGHTCIVKGDGKYLSIAAASILAKTFRDEIMEFLHEEFPVYGWDKNKGYPTKVHREAIQEHGSTFYHRNSFRGATQLRLFSP